MKILLVPLIVGFRFLVHLIVSFRFPSLFRNLFFIYGKSENRPNYTVVLFIFIQPPLFAPRELSQLHVRTVVRIVGSKIFVLQLAGLVACYYTGTCTSSTGTDQVASYFNNIDYYVIYFNSKLLITVTCANVLLTFSYFHWILMSIIYQ